MHIAEIVNSINDLLQDRKSEIQRHNDAIAAIDSSIKMLSEKKAFFAAGIDSEKVEMARSVIDVGSYKDTPERKSVITSAINDLAKGAVRLRTNYFGVKVYSGFGEQRCDCEYGYGPSHGSIVFRVELKNRKDELSSDQIDAAIYYLLNISSITEAKSKVAA